MSGRVVAITGGARGIGAAIARACGAAGMLVAVGDLDGDAATAAAPTTGIGVPLDVTSADSFRAFLDATEERLGPLDVLVNNAGIMWVGAFGDETDEVARRQFDVNVHGVMRGMKLAAPRMRARGHGHIVNIASAASKVAPRGEASYAATKHAVYGYSAAVRSELAGSGVEVSVIMPAVVETELAAGTSGGSMPRLQPSDVADAVVAVIGRPRFEVFVPRRIDPLIRLNAVVPQRVRDAIARRAVPDQIAETDQSQREAYERSRFGD